MEKKWISSRRDRQHVRLSACMVLCVLVCACVHCVLTLRSFAIGPNSSCVSSNLNFTTLLSSSCRQLKRIRSERGEVRRGEDWKGVRRQRKSGKKIGK